MLLDDSLGILRGYIAIPGTFGINHSDRPGDADAQALAFGAIATAFGARKIQLFEPLLDVVPALFAFGGVDAIGAETDEQVPAERADAKFRCHYFGRKFFWVGHGDAFYASICNFHRATYASAAMSFTLGLVIGGLCGLALAAAVAIVAHRRLERLAQRARQAERLAELGTLTGGLAHEIKNPLSTVQLNLQLLREDLDPTHDGYSRLSSRLATLQKETARLRDILDDFLRYAGKMELDRKPVNVGQILEDLVDFYAPQAQLNRVQLRVRPLEGTITANLDEKMIKQAILNLMINALQAIPAEGGEIILSARNLDRSLVIEVMDTGRGMTPEMRDKIFDAYYSTKKGGTGLGLAIARRIIEEHGGNVSVESEPGKGSVFRLTVPLD